MRDILAIYSARLCTELLRFFKLGNGSSLPGRLALKLFPDLLIKANKEINQNPKALKVMVSGTNGKTTSVGLLDSIYENIEMGISAEPHRRKLISNRLGANLYYGISTAFCNFKGDFKEADFILEVDEAALKNVVKHIKPNIMAFTNIFRDQLDRFGEIDATKHLLEEALALVKDEENFKLVLNYDDIKLRSISIKETQNIYFFRLEAAEGFESSFKDLFSLDKDQSLFSEEANNYTNHNFITAKLKSLDTKSSVFDLVYGEESVEINLNLPGIYNVYNALLAASVFIAAGIDLETISKGISAYKGAFGRSQTVFIKSLESKVYLIKNPRGASEVLNMLKNDKDSLYMIVINDNYADGRDVSWLWDADFEALLRDRKELNSSEVNSSDKADKTSSARVSYICSGHRAYDMALRLKYAGILSEEIYVEENLDAALEYATKLAEMQQKKSLNILPTYTALLELEKKLDLCRSI